MTKEEFEQGYAEASGVTVEWLQRMGQEAHPCDCDYHGCKGWKMVSKEAGMTPPSNQEEVT